MDITSKLKQFLYILLILPSIALAQTTAGTEIANIQSWLNSEGQKYYKPGTGDQWVRNSSPNGDRYIKVETNIDYKASNGRNYPVVIEKTGTIDGSKIGKAVVKMAKYVPPLALGFEIYDLICQLSNICKKSDSDTWEKRGTDHQMLPSNTYNGDCNAIPFGQSFIDNPPQLPNGYWDVVRLTASSCNPPGQNLISAGYGVTANCYVPSAPNGCVSETIWAKGVNNTEPPQTEEARPPTETDWTNAEPQLNDPRFDEPLLVNGQPVPLSNLPIFGNNPPITLSDSETINRDGNGNITGTTRTKTTLTLTDTATETRPGSVTGTETTTKTDYDTQGQPTGTQTSTSNPPPPEKPAEPPTISFDDVQDSEIEEEEIDFDLDEGESWGEGFCPPDETINYGYGTLTFDYQPACDFATNVRPVLLLIASITAMFIVSGIRVE